ncbi:MAG: hypothetical protein HFJ80_06695 [Clostridiales bacterium]|nr:hypothetical protein [Clostridiales bacterium]
MGDYYLDLRTRAGKLGRFTIHTRECPYGPSASRRQPLGCCQDEEDAQKRAKELGVSQAELCPVCCRKTYR